VKRSFRVLLPPQDRQLTRADLIECLWPPLDSWDVFIGLPRALRDHKLVARHANGFRVDPSRAQVTPGSYFYLARDVAEWLRSEGCTVTHQSDISGQVTQLATTGKAKSAPVAVHAQRSLVETANARKQRLRTRRDVLKASGERAFLKVMAIEEGISVTRLKTLLGDAPKRRKHPVLAGLFPCGPTSGRRR
jgi:hypothetical protein